MGSVAVTLQQEQQDNIIVKCMFRGA